MNDLMTLRLAILGDSIAYGVGAAQPTDALGPSLARDLTACGLQAQWRTFAVPGARSADLARQVQSARLWQPGIVVIIIGANDLTHLVPPASAAADLGDAVRQLRAAEAEVVVAPAPDLSVLPQVPPAMRDLVQAGSALLRQAQEQAVLGAGGRIADQQGSTSAIFATDPALFAHDRFHPSSAGYAMIAKALAPVVRAAADACGRTDKVG
ncbi:SGNH/GDSL hydrolase family protein [Planosporangium mesophilum]|nr:SGNH/GDSL hydrolase family protein [Planosporangium mesophilum]